MNFQADVILVANGKAASVVDAHHSYRPKVKVVASNDQPDSWVCLLSFATEIHLDTRAAIENGAKSDDLDRTSLVLFTSGTTTGVPKGCPHPVAAWILNMAMQYMGRDQDRPRRSFYTQNFRVIAPVLT